MNNLWMIKAKQLEEDFKLIKTCLYDKHQQKHNFPRFYACLRAFMSSTVLKVFWLN